MSFPDPYGAGPWLFTVVPAALFSFSAWLVANRTLSRSDATVSTPPTIAHVLETMLSINNLSKGDDKDMFELTM